MVEEWSYPSIVGMLLYQYTNTRPHICLPVSQAARFDHSTKQSHATAFKMIVRYLHCTSDKGMIVRPTGNLQIDCLAYVDFGGMYRHEPDSNPTNVVVGTL
jgi:hypothetical protein